MSARPYRYNRNTAAASAGVLPHDDRDESELTAARTAKIATILETAHNAVHDHGVSPSVVGELVIDAIIHDRPYIITASDMAAPIRARTDALLDAVPSGPLTAEG